MISRQRYNSLATKHQQRKKSDNRTSYKNTVQPCTIMLYNNDNTEQNRQVGSRQNNNVRTHKPDRRTSGCCRLRYKCCFYKEKLIFRALTSAKSFRILPKFKPLITLDSMDILIKLFEGSCWIVDLK